METAQYWNFKIMQNELKATNCDSPDAFVHFLSLPAYQLYYSFFLVFSCIERRQVGKNYSAKLLNEGLTVSIYSFSDVDANKLCCAPCVKWAPASSNRAVFVLTLLS